MNFDYCAGLGSFPFRRVPDSSAESLLRLMDAEEIERALVSSFEGIMYRNVQASNELLSQRIAAHHDRLVGASVANPAYPGAAENAYQCIQEMGMRAIRLLPSFHGYHLGHPCVEPVMAVAEELGVPVSVAMRVEDDRQRHWLIQVHPPAPQELADLFGRFCRVRFVLERANGIEANRVLAQAPELANWSLEISGKIPLLPDTGRDDSIVFRLGADRVLLGTDAPLQYPRVALMRLEALGLDPERNGRSGGRTHCACCPVAGDAPCSSQRPRGRRAFHSIEHGGDEWKS